MKLVAACHLSTPGPTPQPALAASRSVCVPQSWAQGQQGPQRPGGAGPTLKCGPAGLAVDRDGLVPCCRGSLCPG